MNPKKMKKKKKNNQIYEAQKKPKTKVGNEIYY